MDNMKGYKSNLEELNALVEKMDKGELSIEELSSLEKLTRELHERSIILRYKAFENKVNPEDTAPVVEEPAPIVEETPEPIVEEEPAIDFSIFDEPEPEVVEEIIEDEVEPVVEEQTPEPEEEIIEEPEPEVENIVEQPKEEEVKKEAPANPFMDNSIAAQFSGGKLDSLIGAFGINQRLGFINNLFDGSSEAFSNAIKELDSQSSLSDANQKVSVFITQYEWDVEEEDVLEFMSYVNRRYAE
jgi:hypothetical protein